MSALPQTFPCPNCREIINDTMETCRYCSVPIDRQIALHAAATQSRVNEACSDASYIKTAAIAMWVFLGLSFIPLTGIFGYAFLVTLIVVIALLVRWQVKFGDILTADPDYVQAKRSKNMALILLLAALFVGFIIRPLIYLVWYYRFA
ncbi:MAG: hypothetical protein WBP93_13075 [Pyrinomonadaceae bacterium]